MHRQNFPAPSPFCPGMGIEGWGGLSGVPGTLDGRTPRLPSPRGGYRSPHHFLPYPPGPMPYWSSRFLGQAGDLLGFPSPGGHPGPYSQSPTGSQRLLRFSPRRWQQQQQQQQTYPRHPPKTSTPPGVKRGGERRMSDELEDYFKPSMLQDPWAGLEPVSAEGVSQQQHSGSKTFTDRRGRRSC